MHGNQLDLPPDVKDQVQLQEKDGKPLKPTWSDHITSWDSMTESGLRIWYRVCSVIVSSVGVGFLIKLFFRPDGIDKIIELVKSIISLGSGFAVPILFFVLLVIRLLNYLFIRNGFSK